MISQECQKNFYRNPYIIISKESYQNLTSGNEITFPKDHKQHFLNVQRIKQGSLFFVGNGEGRLLQAILDNGNLVDLVEFPSVIKKQNLILSQAVIKKKNLELVIQKATECGVSQINLFTAQFSQKQSIKTDRIEQQIKMAAMQSRQLFLPKVTYYENLKVLVNQGCDNKITFFGDLYNDEKRLEFNKTSFHYINGPEGGWHNTELQILKKSFRSMYLGDHVLRSETAAIAALSVYNFFKANEG